MRINRILLLAALGMVSGCSESSPDADLAVRNPVQEIDWTGPGSFNQWGQTKDGFFGISADVFGAWTWNEATLERGEGVKLPRLMDMIPLPAGDYLACIRPGVRGTPWPLTMAPLGAKDVIKKWEPPAGWSYRHVGISRNRAYAAVTAHDHDANPVPDSGYRVGILNIATKNLYENRPCCR